MGSESYRKLTQRGEAMGVMLVALLVCGVIAAILALMFGIPQWKVYQQRLAGEAKLREAESSRQIRIEEAKAERAAAQELAQAEIERAKGVAAANQIIGDSLKGNDAYLRYLWIQGLSDGSGETIYVPTEANLPILEATRRGGG